MPDLTRRSLLGAAAAMMGAAAMPNYGESLGSVGTSLDADLTELSDRVATLEDKHKPPPEPLPSTEAMVGLDMRNYDLYVGGNANEPGEMVLGPSYIGRTFADPSESNTILAKGDAASVLDAWQARPYRQNERRQLFSMKPNVDKCINRDDTTMAALAAIATSLRDDDMFTVYHEPENDMSADRWWSMFGPVYEVMKAARPALSIGYCAMTYQHAWGNAVGLSESWCRAEPSDWYGADDYGPHPYSGKNFNVSLDTKKEWQAWYKAASKVAGGSGQPPLRATEFGRSGKDPAAVAARPAVLTDSFRWCIDRGFDAFMYWNSSTGQSGTWWPLDDVASQDAWHSIVAQGRGQRAPADEQGWTQ